MSDLSLFFLSFSWVLISLVLLPVIKNDYWVFRICEYPRYQKLILCVVALAGLIYSKVYTTTTGLITTAVITLCIIYLITKIWPYTPLGEKEMKALKQHNDKNQIRFYSANVYQENKQYNKLLNQIKATNPDVVFLIETDSRWEKEMDVLLHEYPHYLKEPRDNTYGMLLYSKLEIVKGEIKYLVEDEVPSVEAIIKLRSGQLVKLFGLHPKPPVPKESTSSASKDKELIQVAFKVRHEKLPVIVVGDLNDVAWSNVTKLFRKTSGLLDPRRGRGFYSTFSANNWFMRFPLDYIFCSDDFRLVEMKRLSHNGSDHFPMYSHFEYYPKKKSEQNKPEADKGEISEAKEVAQKQV